MITDQEISEIADKHGSTIKEYNYVSGDYTSKDVIEYDAVKEFARAIEAKVRAEYEPKFKIGDKVRIYGSSIARKVLQAETRATYALSGIWAIVTEGAIELVEEAE